MTNIQIKVGMASCGLAAGAQEIYDQAKKLLSGDKYNFELKHTACNGMCHAEPLIQVVSDDGSDSVYGNLVAEDLESIFDVLNKQEIAHEKLVYSNKIPAQENYLIESQTRIVLRNCGVIDPVIIDEYIARQGYSALKKALTMTGQAIIGEITESGLRGRGGAGFPTGLKWKFAYDNKSEKKYVICNADEGDPGAFMDRSVLEGDPHAIIEGMIIGAYAIGADEGYLYVRAEYPLAIKHLNIAIEQAQARGFLGDNILGSDFSFHLHIKEGAGAFVCGEETALMASVEGKRGMPNLRPPFPAESGLWQYPTNINNVETWANITWIILNGAEEFAKLGTEKSKGTKVFALAGKIRNSGLIEVPMGISLHDVIYKVGGGMKTQSPFKAVQLGGPSGGCVPATLLDTIVDYDSISQTGAIMGSGGMVVMDYDTCMVDVAKFFLNFTQNESCGKCTFCRIGTKRMLEILERITSGKGQIQDIEILENLSEKIITTSLCGLGQTAPNPVLTTLKYFRQEYEAHIVDKTCPAHVCTDLLTYHIIEDKCVGCTACARVCPVNCISGQVKEAHLINQDSCIKCGSCYKACKFSAIEIR
jgi:NADH-quinone oxidoreductase subunit F